MPNLLTEEKLKTEMFQLVKEGEQLLVDWDAWIERHQEAWKYGEKGDPWMDAVGRLETAVRELRKLADGHRT